MLKGLAVAASFPADGTVVGSIRAARGFHVPASLEVFADLSID
jgi:hypothetical protein